MDYFSSSRQLLLSDNIVLSTLSIPQPAISSLSRQISILLKQLDQTGISKKDAKRTQKERSQRKANTQYSFNQTQFTGMFYSGCQQLNINQTDMPRRQLSVQNESGSKLSAELFILFISSCFLNLCSFSLSKNGPYRLKQNHHCAKEMLALSSVAFLPLDVGCGVWTGQAGNQAPAQRRNAAREPVGSGVGGWQVVQMRRAQEVFWGMHCSQKKQKATHPRGNGNCKGIADTSALLRSQQQTQGVPCFLTDCIVQFSHSSPHTRTSTHVLL